MSEPEFIPNTTPHEVAMPAGARNAMGKSALVGEPAIHRVLAQVDAHAAALPLPAENLTPAASELTQLKVPKLLSAHETANPVAAAKEQHADITVPQSTETAPTATAGLKSHLSEDLAARLEALKAENDQVLQQLEKLETLMDNHP